MKKYPQWEEICSASRKTLKSFKLPNQAGPEKSKTNLCTSKTVLGVTILRINGIKEGKNKLLEDYDERVNCFLEEKLHMDTSEISQRMIKFLTYNEKTVICKE